MNHIKTFDYRTGKRDFTMNRTAVRAVIKKDDLYLLIYLTESKEFKFPGGGVKKNETLTDCLIREVLEESGYHISKVIKEIGFIDQLHDDIYDCNKDFSMRSIYYECTVSNDTSKLALDDYELDLGFTPMWVPLHKALEINRIKLKSGSNYHWTERETYMLEHLKNSYI